MDHGFLEVPLTHDQMTSQKRFWMGFWAFAPLVALIPYFITIFVMMFGMFSKIPMSPGSPPPDPEEMMGNFMGIWASVAGFAFILTILNIASMVIYLIHVVKDQRPDAANNRTMWILLIVLLGTIGRIVYYFARVRTDVGPAQPLPPFQVTHENR